MCWISSRSRPTSPHEKLPPSQQQSHITTSGAWGTTPIDMLFQPSSMFVIFIVVFLISLTRLPLTSFHALKKSPNRKNKPIVMIIHRPDDFFTSRLLLG